MEHKNCSKRVMRNYVSFCGHVYDLIDQYKVYVSQGYGKNCDKDNITELEAL